MTNFTLPYSQAHYDLEVTSWDYTQRYPNPDNDILSGLTDTSGLDEDPGAEQDPDMDSPFSADVTVNGDITARVYVVSASFYDFPFLCFLLRSVLIFSKDTHRRVWDSLESEIRGQRHHRLPPMRHPCHSIRQRGHWHRY